MWQNSYDNSPTLYLVPTPIGNMEDMTVRAINTLKLVDVVFSEDTRVTLQLLNYFSIKKKLIALHDHNEESVKINVLEYLKNGQKVAIVTDRGTPIISDPGYKTVKFIRENGYNVVALPGACAFVPAIVASGLNSEHFIFYGFLSGKISKTKQELETLKDCEWTIIFYEAPHRIENTLNLIYNIFGDREISISHEISKLHESVYCGRLSNLINSNINYKGEYVICVAPNDSEDIFEEDMMDSINRYIKNGLTSMEAIKKVAKERKIPKSDVYKFYVERS